MKPQKILAPHKEQDGWVYWRVKETTAAASATAPSVNPLWLVRKDTLECVKASDIGIAVGYTDDTTGSRIISSRRVERAVETDDFLRLCAEEGLSPMLHDGEWVVGRWFDSMPTLSEGFYMNESNGSGVVGIGPTLREAYYRYHAAVDAS